VFQKLKRPQTSILEMSDAKAIRKHSAQHDLFNRIHSIAADEAFVRKVADSWYEGRFDVIGELDECPRRPCN
jgi:hypothetical protein